MNLPYTRAHGGTNRSNRFLAEALAMRGHSVEAVVPMLASPSSITEDQWLTEQVASGAKIETTRNMHSFLLKGVQMRAVRRPEQIRAVLVESIRKFSPDLVCVSSEDTSQNLLDAALQTLPSRVVYLAHTPQLFPFGQESLYPSELRSELVRSCRAVICISRFVQDYIRQHLGLEAFLNHPPHYGIPPFPQCAREDGYILLMNASAVKGISIFLELARRFPHLPFAALPGYATTPDDLADMAKCPNVTILSNQPDLNGIFAQVRILLMPTLWAEGFGMAVVDALLRGIPVLAANYGGLIEAKLGTGYLLPVSPIQKFERRLAANLLPVPIIPPQNAAPWVEALEEITTDHGLYRQQSEKSRAAALQFVSSLSVEPLEKLLSNLTHPVGHGNAAMSNERLTLRHSPVLNNIARLTPEQKSALIERLAKRQASGNIQSNGIKPSDRTGPLPLSPEQEQICLMEHLHRGSVAYIVPAGLRLRGTLDIQMLSRSLNEVVRRHEILRTVFRTRDGSFQQIVRPAREVDIRVLDLSCLSAGSQTTILHEAIRKIVSCPFDLENDQLFRAQLLRLSKAEHVLLLVSHHIAFDGGSARIFAQDLSSLYRAYHRRSALPPLPSLQYGDYAIWAKQSRCVAKELDFWKKQLSAVPRLSLHGSRAAEKTLAPAGQECFSIDRDTTAALKFISNSAGVTMFALLMTAFMVILRDWSQQTDIVVGTDVTTRDFPQLDSVIGYFVNQAAIRMPVTDGSSFSSLLKYAGNIISEALANKHAPFHRVVHAVSPDRDPGTNPIFETKFVWNPVPCQWELDGMSVESMRIVRPVAKFDLTLFIDDDDNVLKAELEFNAARFNRELIARKSIQLSALLAEIARNPDGTIGELLDISHKEVKKKMDPAENPKQLRPSFKSFKPQSIAAIHTQPVRESFPKEAKLPLILEPATPDINIVEWVQANAKYLEQKLAECGALLFRGFAIAPHKDLEKLARVFSPELFSENGEHPSLTSGGSIYTPVFYPSEKKLLWHNENSFNYRWPALIWFCCDRPAATGGETPIVDSRTIFASLEPRLRDAFLEKQIMYVRNYGSGLGLHWQEVFGTSDRHEVEAKCQKEQMEYRWKDGGVLETRAVRPAVLRHPSTGAMSWFNQAQHWHISCVDAETRNSLQGIFAEHDLPRNCYFGDGSPIPDAALEHILETYRRHEVVFPWQARDILMLDNIAVAHGRNPFRGERRHLVALGRMMTWEQAGELACSAH
ncbi:MAG TPA: condensation domain-containing protein [Candidatus Angelobacter sp.]|nr:condensation domain-containing protein [Candidatus Angelobacter sp.]